VIRSENGGRGWVSSMWLFWTLQTEFRSDWRFWGIEISEKVDTFWIQFECREIGLKGESQWSHKIWN
jgi:hypothetical protein